MSQNVFLTTYVCNSGVMAFAVIAFNNQAQFANTDHVTSSYIHTLPLVTNWAIRWRHKIYSKDVVENSGFNFYEFGDLQFANDEILHKLITLPLIFWAFWAVSYYMFNSTIFRKYIENPKYFSGVGDFRESSRNLKFIYGDIEKHTLIKYLLQHLAGFILTMPFAIGSFYSYRFNSFYVLAIIAFISWNTGRNNIKHLERKLRKSEAEATKIISENTTNEKKDNEQEKVKSS
jgi:hypothetical protein